MSSLLLARLLRTLSRRLLIVCTIHQPSNAVLAQFDVLLLVKPPGTLAFYGPFDLAARFFQQLPARFPAQLGDVHIGAPALADNLADMVLGALKVVSKLEGEAPQSEDKAVAPFSCRDAFLHSPFSQPLLRALVHVHGEKAISEAGLPAPAPSAPRNDGTEKEHKQSESDFAGVDFAIPLPPRSKLQAGGEKRGLDGSSPSSSSGAAGATWSAALRSQWFAFRELLRRFAVSTVRARRSFTLRFFTCIVYGFVTGTLFYQLQLGQKAAASRISFIYFAARFSLFSGNLKLPGVFSTRVMMFRETTTRMYSPLAYAAARSVADLPWVAIEMLLFGVIVYFFSGLQSDGQLFGLFYLVLLLDRLISIGFIELVGALTPTIELAQSLQTAINMLFMLFSGFFIAVQAIPRGWRWMTYLSPYYYVIRFLANNEYTRIDEFRCADDQRVAVPLGYDTCPVTAAMRDSDSKCPLQCGAEVLQLYSIPQQSGFLYEDLGILILFALAYPILAALALRFVNFIRR
jgi:ABC-type multidrug transport system permease subunit